MKRESALDISDPNTSAATPKVCDASGAHSFVVQKLDLSWCSAGSAFTTRKTAMAPSSTNTRSPAAIVTRRNTASARRVDRPADSGTESVPVDRALIEPSSLSADAVDALLGLRLQRGRQRCEAERGGLR